MFDHYQTPRLANHAHDDTRINSIRRYPRTSLLGGLLLLLWHSTLPAATRPADDPLPRQADLGFSIETSDAAWLEIRAVVSDSPADRAGLQTSDRIVTVNGQSFDHGYVAEAILEKHRGDEPLTLVVQRGTETASTLNIQFTPASRPLESIPGVVSYYRHVSLADGSRLRAMISHAEGATTPLPALLFTQWVSCGSIEYRAGSNAFDILATLARDSGRALIRVERSTSGDSQGPACHELDYNTELAHYHKAFLQLLKDPLIAAGPVMVYGSSLGSTTAPLVAKALKESGIELAGVAVQGGGALTYYERMLNFDRIYLERREGTELANIHAEMIARARFHYEYLIHRRDPDAIATDSSTMAQVRSDVLGMGQGQHYGRPYAWHQQAAQHNFLVDWLALDTPVLVIFNTYEQFETRHGHELIAKTLNQLRPGSATYVEQAGVGHSNNHYPSIGDAYAWRGGTSHAAQTARVILDWMHSNDL